MPALIAALLGFFSTTGPIASFFYSIGKKLTLTALIMPIQIALVGALVTAKVSMLVAIVTLIVWIYNQFIVVLNLINTQISSSILEIPVKVLQSLGLIQAMNETFALFSLVFIPLLLAFISKLAVSSLQSLSDEYYKIGVLLQLGLK
ncbi:MAG: hypothetical protein RBR70_05330 [Arcobacter sp.]|jgi:hypothetical protein|uniref:hypothetical protein n=1 Tax=Arcobacter sp. TaxID=1872629 RepID=UPI002A75E4BA|nr:hypothetical protein [Arcobacter sp.]MDY3204475.1 hypothetical protein [Arcobacter sp.]